MHRYGADLTKQNDLTGLTLLHWAAFHGCSGVGANLTAYLLAHGCSPVVFCKVLCTRRADRPACTQQVALLPPPPCRLVIDSPSCLLHAHCFVSRAASELRSSAAPPPDAPHAVQC